MKMETIKRAVDRILERTTVMRNLKIKNRATRTNGRLRQNTRNQEVDAVMTGKIRRMKEIDILMKDGGRVKCPVCHEVYQIEKLTADEIVLMVGGGGCPSSDCVGRKWDHA